jgi:hypothetical protein
VALVVQAVVVLVQNLQLLEQQLPVQEVVMVQLQAAIEQQTQAMADMVVLVHQVM